MTAAHQGGLPSQIKKSNATLNDKTASHYNTIASLSSQCILIFLRLWFIASGDMMIIYGVQ